MSCSLFCPLFVPNPTTPTWSLFSPSSYSLSHHPVHLLLHLIINSVPTRVLFPQCPSTSFAVNLIETLHDTLWNISLPSNSPEFSVSSSLQWEISFRPPINFTSTWLLLVSSCPWFCCSCRVKTRSKFTLHSHPSILSSAHSMTDF